MAKFYSFVVVSKGADTVYTVGKPIRDCGAYLNALCDPDRYCYDSAEILSDCAGRDEIDRLIADCEAKGIRGGKIVFGGGNGPLKPVPERYQAARRAVATIIGADPNDFYLDADGCEVEVAGDGDGYWCTAYAVRVTATAEERIRERVEALPAGRRDWVKANTSWMTTMDADGPSHRRNARYLLLDANA